MARILIVEDEERIASFVSKGLARRRPPHHRGGRRAGGARPRPQRRVRPDGARHRRCPAWTASRCSTSSAPRARSSRSSSSPRATRSRTPSPRSRAVPTTTCPSRSASPSCSPGSGSGSAPPPTAGTARDDVLEAGGVRLDVRTRRATVGERELELSAREFSLAETLMVNAGQVLSREQLLDQVWGFDFDPGSNVVDVYVGYLRKKFGATAIATVRGHGLPLQQLNCSGYWGAATREPSVCASARPSRQSEALRVLDGRAEAQKDGLAIGLPPVGWLRFRGG